MNNDYAINGRYYGRTLISPRTLRKVKDEQENLLRDPFHRDVLIKKQMKSLFQESNVNSARLESELMLGSSLENQYKPKASKKEIEEDARKLSQGVYEAWNWAKGVYDGNLTIDLITGLGKILDPMSNRGTLRNSSAKVGFGLSAISPDKLQSQPGYEGYLDRFLRELNNNSIFLNRNDDFSVPISPVEKAVYAHFMLFYLQPNMDANKRTARVVQNLNLDEADLPPPIIYASETQEYTKFLVDAFSARRVRDGNPQPNEMISAPEQRFFEYIGRKVLISLEKANYFLDKKKNFYVVITNPPTNNDRLYFSAKNALQSLIRKRDPEGSVRLRDKRDYLQIRGSLTRADISAVMDSLESVGHYEIDAEPPFG